MPRYFPTQDFARNFRCTHSMSAEVSEMLLNAQKSYQTFLTLLRNEHRIICSSAPLRAGMRRFCEENEIEYWNFDDESIGKDGLIDGKLLNPDPLVHHYGPPAYMEMKTQGSGTVSSQPRLRPSYGAARSRNIAPALPRSLARRGSRRTRACRRRHNWMMGRRRPDCPSCSCQSWSP